MYTKNEGDENSANQYAPILMKSVDTDPELCLEERKAIMQRLEVEKMADIWCSRV